MVSIHDRALPRSGSYRVAERQISRNASWVTSSAWARSRTTRRTSPNTRDAAASYRREKDSSSPHPQALSRVESSPDRGGTSPAPAPPGQLSSGGTRVMRTMMRYSREQAASGRREQHAVDDVDGGVGGGDVAADHLGLAVDGEALTGALDLDDAAAEGLVLAREVGRRELAGHHVVGEDL